MILIVNCVLQKCLRVVENMRNGVGTENHKKDNTNSINGKLENNETSNSKPNDDKDKSNSDDKDNTVKIIILTVVKQIKTKNVKMKIKRTGVPRRHRDRA